MLIAPGPIRNEILHLSADDYHADPAPPSLSASIAHVLVKQSPAHAHSRHPRLGGVMPAPTRSMDRGTLAHALILGAGKEIAIVEGYDDYRSPKAREARDMAISQGKIPVLAEEYDDASFTARALRGKFASRFGIEFSGESEIVALWGEAVGGAEVQCRAMMDHIALPRVYDLKSCRSAHPDACQRHAEDYGYAIQRAAYVSAIEHLRPEWAGRVDFIFVFYELEPPFEVTPLRMAGPFRELGERRWRRAVATWERCLRTNTWPGYADGIIDLEPPPWALAKDLDQEMAAARSTWLKELP